MEMVKIEANTLFIDITNVCNFNCPFCLNGLHNEEEKHMSLDQFKMFLKKCLDYKITDVILSGGEPLCHPQIMQFMELINQSSIRLRLITNGYLVSEDVLNFFISNDRHIIQISLDGSDAKTSDYYRFKGGFEKNIKTVEILRRNGFENIILRMTIAKRNYHQVKEFYDKFSKDSYISFSPVQALGTAQENWDDLSLSNKEMACIQKQMREIVAVNPKMASEERNLRPIATCPLFSEDPVISPSINIDGDVFPCNMYHTDFVLGNIFVDDFDDIFNKNFYSERKRIKDSISLRLKDVCGTCILKNQEKCTGGCPARWLYNRQRTNMMECMSKRREFFYRNHKKILFGIFS